MPTTIELAPHCKVKLVQHTGSDLMIAGAAWVSVSGEEAESRLNEREDADVGKVINFLMSHRHGTPFEHNSMTFFIDGPIFMWREFHRHRIGVSYNEVSGRYSKLKPRFWMCPPGRPLVEEPNFKATRPKFVAGTDQQLRELHEVQADAYSRAYAQYELLLEKGIAKEVARSVLPVGLMSQCWVTCNARSMMHFLGLRTHEPAARDVSYPQEEIQEVARLMEKEFAELFPVTYEAFNRRGRIAP